MLNFHDRMIATLVFLIIFYLGELMFYFLLDDPRLFKNIQYDRFKQLFSNTQREGKRFTKLNFKRFFLIRAR